MEDKIRTFICTGFYTTDKRIKDKLKRDNHIEFDQGIIVFTPSTLFESNFYGSLLEEDDISRGYMKLDDLEISLREYESIDSILSDDVLKQLKDNNLEIAKSRFSIAEKEEKMLKQLNINNIEINTWYFEYIRNTIDNSYTFIKKIPVV